MTADPLRGDPECPEVQSVRRCARLYSAPEPEPGDYTVSVLTPEGVRVTRKIEVRMGVLTVALSLALSAPILTALFLSIMLTRRGM